MLKSSLLIGLVVVHSACGKYDDGPNVSLLTKKQRLQRQWDLDEYMNDSGSTLKDNSSAFWELEKDGDAEFTDDDGTKSQGKWELDDEKERLIVTAEYPFVGTVVLGNFKIKRLTKKELWLYDETDKITEKYKAK